MSLSNSVKKNFSFKDNIELPTTVAQKSTTQGEDGEDVEEPEEEDRSEETARFLVNNKTYISYDGAKMYNESLDFCREKGLRLPTFTNTESYYNLIREIR